MIELVLTFSDQKRRNKYVRALVTIHILCTECVAQSSVQYATEPAKAESQVKDNDFP